MNNGIAIKANGNNKVSNILIVWQRDRQIWRMIHNKFYKKMIKIMINLDNILSMIHQSSPQKLQN